MRKHGRSNLQIVVLMTDEGSAAYDEQLQQMWEERLKVVAPHYKVMLAKILLRVEDGEIVKVK